MSTPLPPPPPKLLIKYHLTTVQLNLIEECLWALKYPELQKACFLARICQSQPPSSCQFYNINSILQEGPTCGLTALSMIFNGKLAVEDLLLSAKQLHYTINGEMFSARNLFALICDKIQLVSKVENTNTFANMHNNNADVIECLMYEGRLNCAKIKEDLIAGACIFVPYDADFNHAPCLRNGHKAHWALIIGYLITSNDEFYVLARHGKTKNLAAWSLEALSKSNSNLFEFAQPKGYPNCDFLLPPGGIDGNLGLRERAIIVKGLPQQTIIFQ